MKNRETTLHRSKEYKDLSYLIGEPLNFIHGLTVDSLIKKPDGKARITADYGRTVMVELTFIHSDFTTKAEPRHIKMLIPKASLCCGDFLLQRECNKEFLIADYISDLVFANSFTPQTSVEYLLW